MCSRRTGSRAMRVFLKQKLHSNETARKGLCTKEHGSIICYAFTSVIY